MKAIIICVDYDDFLAVTLPANHVYFERIVVVTDLQDGRTAAVASRFRNVTVHRTDAFYDRGAVFNKGAALEEGFDVLGRDGWICILDADIRLPPNLVLPELCCGFLYGARRRMLDRAEAYSPELNWRELPLKNEELAGYFQLFHAADPQVARLPWYPLDWRHAGVCDTAFQMRWPLSRQRWLPAEVLHIGPCTANWQRRVTARIDTGERPPEADERRARLRRMFALRQTHGLQHEMLPPADGPTNAGPEPALQKQDRPEAAARSSGKIEVAGLAKVSGTLRALRVPLASGTRPASGYPVPDTDSQRPETFGLVGEELLYSRDGFPDKTVILHPSGAVINGPGFNEQCWRAVGDRLELLSRDGVPRARP